MPVKMRLHRVGAKHQPSYRIVITPALTPRDGSYLDQVGFYDPVTEPATIRLDTDKVVSWLRKGVQPTDRVIRLLKSANIDPVAVRRGDTPTQTEIKPARTRSASPKTKAREESSAGDVSTTASRQPRSKAASAKPDTVSDVPAAESPAVEPNVAEIATEQESEPSSAKAMPADAETRPAEAIPDNAEAQAANDATPAEATPSKARPRRTKAAAEPETETAEATVDTATAAEGEN